MQLEVLFEKCEDAELIGIPIDDTFPTWFV